MNKEAMYKVADAIERENSVRLNMNKWIGTEPIYPKDEHCGTAACVAGFTLFALDPEAFANCMKNLTPDGVTEEIVSTPARELLDLTIEEAGHLFIPSDLIFASINEHRSEVPAILRWMADNDTVSWEAAIDATGSHIEYWSKRP